MRAYDELHELRKKVESDLINHTDIPNSVATNFPIHVRHKPDGGTVFDYPKKPYLETKQAYVDYADTVESVISEHVDVERREITHRTDGKVDTHYWVVQNTSDL